LAFPAYFAWVAQYGSAISTRRFFALPTSVALLATGLVLPKPLAVSRSAVTPCCVSQLTIALARASDSVWLYAGGYLLKSYFMAITSYHNEVRFRPMFAFYSGSGRKPMVRGLLSVTLFIGAAYV
jgi:hypothetical protein